MVRWLNSPIMMFVVALGAGVLVVSLWGTVQRTQHSAEQVQVLEQENAKMASEVFELEHETKIASSEAQKEKTIRNELLMQKPGEVVVQLPEFSVTEPSPQPSPRLQPWQEWKTLLLE